MWIQMKKHCLHEWYDGAAVSGSCSSGMNQHQGIYLERQESKRVQGRRSWPRSWSTETANSGAGDLLVKWHRDQLSFDLYSCQLVQYLVSSVKSPFSSYRVGCQTHSYCHDHLSFQFSSYVFQNKTINLFYNSIYKSIQMDLLLTVWLQTPRKLVEENHEM